MDEEKQTAQFDEVRCPAHYAGDGEVECKRAMRSMAAGYDKSTASTACRYWAIAAFKYLWRFPLKGKPLEDLRKARECIDLAIESCEAGKERPGCWLRLDTVKTGSLPDDHWHTQWSWTRNSRAAKLRGVRE